MMVNEKRFAGCLVGLACGDALGGPVEEIPGHPSQVSRPVTEMIGGGHFGLRIGQITDDTEMALCIVRSLLEKQGCDPVDIAKKFQEWYFDSPIGAGGTVKAAMERLRDGDAWYEAGHSKIGRRSLGNGSVMRCAPMALYSYYVGQGTLYFSTFQQGCITHTNHECISAAYFINLIIDRLMSPLTERPYDAFAYAIKNCSFTAMEHYNDIPSLKKVEPLGTVHNTVKAAVHCLLTTQTFEEALIKAANLGGDADTIAAITGAMAGAWYGIEAIPTRWSSMLVDRHGHPILLELYVAAENLHRLAFKISEDVAFQESSNQLLQQQQHCEQAPLIRPEEMWRAEEKDVFTDLP